MRATPSYAPPLAAELYDRITDFLHDDWRALVACALTGPLSPLTPCAEYHLLSGFGLPISRSQGELLDFLHIFRPEAPLACRQLVRSVHIYGTRARVLDATLPMHMNLSHLPNLRALSLSYLNIESNEGLVLFLSGLPSLEELTLEGLVSGVPTAASLSLQILSRKSGAPSMAALYRRLKILRLLQNLRASDTSVLSPYGQLYQCWREVHAAGSGGNLRAVALQFHYSHVWCRWLHMLGDDNPFLEHIELTTKTPMGIPVVLLDEQRNDRVEMRSTARGNLYGFMLRHPCLRSLYVRYHPWELPLLTHSSSVDGNAKFLHSIALVFSALSASPGAKGTTSTPRCPNLESVALVLSVLPDARADTDAFRTLAQALVPARWPRLARVKVAIEPVEPMDIRSDELRLHVLSSGTEQEADVLGRYAEAARRALATLSDPTDGRMVELVVCTQPSSSVP